MQLNKDGDDVIINQEIYATRFPKVEYHQVLYCVQYTNILNYTQININKSINSNTYVTMAQW